MESFKLVFQRTAKAAVLFLKPSGQCTIISDIHAPLEKLVEILAASFSCSSLAILENLVAAP